MMPEFPRALLRERRHSWNLAGVAAAGGQTASNVSTLIRSDGGGFWTCSMSDVGLSGGPGLTGRDRQRVATLLWRAVRQICNGGASNIVVPRNDALFRPWPEGLAHTVGLSVSHGDETLFGDGAGYYQSVIDIVAAAAARRATSLEIAVNYAGELLGGESFSIEHPTLGWRLYEIKSVDMVSDSEGLISFNPPLREAVTDGTPLEFDRPRCVMRLAQPRSMDLDVVASVAFIEGF
jgi:hypothetical protein